MSNFFDTVRNLKVVQENANCDYSAMPEKENTTQPDGKLVEEKDPAAALAARRHSQEAHALSQTAHYHGGSHLQAAAAHAFAYEAHHKLAKQKDPHAAAYHRVMADAHHRMSMMHNDADPKGLKLHPSA